MFFVFHVLYVWVLCDEDVIYGVWCLCSVYVWGMCGVYVLYLQCILSVCVA